LGGTVNEIHALNIDKAIGLCIFFLSGSEMTKKIKQLEVEGWHMPQCPIAGDANGYHERATMN